MAGIGFVLRKLVQRETLTGVIRGYFHASLASTGPWVLTVIALCCLYGLTSHFVLLQSVTQFRTVILYNFCFSLVWSSPLTVLATRYLSDCIFRKDMAEAPGMLLGTMLFLVILTIPIGAFFYLYASLLSLDVAIQALCNFVLIAVLWLATVFISTIKYYSAITYSFLVGLSVAVLAAAALGVGYGAAGMLLGFNCGIACILASILALILVEYPRETCGFFGILSYLKRYTIVALAALLYTMGCWVDKWVMWFAPEAQTFGTGLPNYPHYDGSMFLAYLTIIPVMAMFMISQETQFFDTYTKYYRSVLNEENYNTIQRNHQQMLHFLVQSGAHMLLLQSFVCGLFLIAAPKIFEFFNINFIGLGIFRIGVVGASFQVLTLFITIFMSYFDDRKNVLWVSGLFFLTNFLFSVFSQEAGLPYYGYGYFLSTLVTFVFAAITIERYVRNLPYHTFIDNNSSVVE